MATADIQPKAATLYRTIWRWHFYAGLFVMPFIVLLSITGAIYLFKPQIDAWEEAGYRGLPVANAVSSVALVDATLAQYPGAKFVHYRVPVSPGDAALVHLGMPGDSGMRDVFVSPQGMVLASLDPEARISATVARIHGSLLIGKLGDWLVELAASWALVMILTGLYLWWPRGRGFAGVIWPRPRAFLRDLHAVTGFWVAGLALVMLASGLPWSGAWGGALKVVRAEFGLTKGPAEWKIGAGPSGPARPEHVEHDHAAMMQMASAPAADFARLPEMVGHARSEGLAFPAIVLPPGAPARFGPPSMNWTIKSEAQNRTLVRSIDYDAATGKEVSRKGFADKDMIDRVIGYGISWHEGALFGWVNQLIGVLTAIMLVTMVVTSFLLWRRRKPAGVLGAPPFPAVPARIGGVVAIIFALALLLPLLALSLVALFLFDGLILPRLPRAARWLGAT